jgi:hypothetical protein
MRPGSLVGDFEIERLAGSGAMGAVHRAHHRVTGAVVALKVLHGHRPEHADRFAREARVLSELNHPGIVHYVAHGVTPEGDPYLAMEWLEGESLADRLVRQPLTLTESLGLGLAVAEALRVPHRMGIVHRDLKPSNLLLVGGRVDRTTVMDFGIARLLDGAGTMLTATGAMLGTPGYMAPEQARGEPDVDARADVFALGAVLFRCLTGRPAFDGEDLLAVLMKTAMEDAPRSTERRPDIPGAVDDLVARMLARAPAERLADASEVAAQLAATMRAPGMPLPPGASRMLSRFEARTSCLLVARPAAAAARGATSVLPAPLRSEQRALAAIADSHHGTLALLADGSLVVAFTDDASPPEQAARAARCALALRPLLPGTRMALVASAAQPTLGMTLIDRAARALTSAGEDSILLDEAAAHCLPAAGFTLAPTRAGRTLLGAAGQHPVPTRAFTEAGRTLESAGYGRAAPRGPAPVAPGAVVPRPASNPFMWAAISFGGLLFVLLVLAASVLVGMQMGTGKPGSGAITGPVAFVTPCPGVHCENLDVPDPSRVDGVVFFARARQLAEATERGAKLIHIVQTGRGDGTADVSKGGKGYIHYTFQRRAADGKSHDGVLVMLNEGRVIVSRMQLGSGSLVTPDPTCTTARVIKAASGTVPASAPVTLTYSSIGDGALWIVSAEGSQQTGMIDGRTCAKKVF